MTVNIHDAKSQLSALIQKVLSGEKVIIAKNNSPLVEIVPLRKQARIPGLLKDKIKFSGDLLESDEELLSSFETSEIFP